MLCMGKKSILDLLPLLSKLYFYYVFKFSIYKILILMFNLFVADSVNKINLKT